MPLGRGSPCFSIPLCVGEGEECDLVDGCDEGLLCDQSGAPTACPLDNERRGSRGGGCFDDARGAR